MLSWSCRDVGPGYFRDAVEAANCNAGIAWTTKANLKARAGFVDLGAFLKTVHSNLVRCVLIPTLN
jgi:hypothetical protein